MLISEVLVNCEEDRGDCMQLWKGSEFANIPCRELEIQLHQVASSPPDLSNPCSSKSLLRKAERLEETESALDS